MNDLNYLGSTYEKTVKGFKQMLIECNQRASEWDVVSLVALDTKLAILWRRRTAVVNPHQPVDRSFYE